MNVEVTAVVMRHAETGEVLDVVAIRSDDADVAICYPAYLLGSAEAVNIALRSSFGHYAENADLRASVVLSVLEGRSPVLNDYACRLPSIGDCRVSVETAWLPWPDAPPKAKSK